jgi:hypothetical protein
VLIPRQVDREISISPGLDSQNSKAIDDEINSDIKNALKYARGSKYGLREPELKETGLGILVSDDLVPNSVHAEVSKY